MATLPMKHDMNSAPTTPSLDELLALFRAGGGTDEDYLRHHFGRFVATKREFLSTWDRARGSRLLDVGAHWLHQSVLYALDGFDVTAIDLPVTMEMANVRAVAAAHDIKLIPNADLAEPEGLCQIPDGSVDVVLFTEIIEHITFNPVAMWREIVRIAKPGTRIIVTTPNYYALRGRAWDLSRFFTGFGGGIEVLNILQSHTYAHHWKEYSRREIIYYFCALSEDFNTIKATYLTEFDDDYLEVRGSRLTKFVERLIPFLRPNLHIEIELTGKSRGIRIEPTW
jgi:2-polyprenyl-3-methyl-5-hydroxy-6-metoxy-1,4-benzoquinol methylase